MSVDLFFMLFSIVCVVVFSVFGVKSIERVMEDDNPLPPCLEDEDKVCTKFLHCVDDQKKGLSGNNRFNAHLNCCLHKKLRIAVDNKDDV